jgi:hypothetical protein
MVFRESFVLRCSLLLAAALPSALGAQDLSGHRIGPLTLSGEASGSVAPKDTAFFNDTGYDVYPLRMLSISLSAQLHLGGRAAVLAEGVSENGEAPRVRGLYLRLRPFPERSFDLQAGRIPPVFGSFGRRAYGSSNPLIGIPLGYQYLTTVRSDAAADNPDSVLRVRGRGWLVSYPVGNRKFAPGLPLVSSRFWDTGIEARLGRDPVSLAVAVTQGTLAAPRLSDDNRGKQISARVAWTPRTGLILGLSMARGQYAETSLMAALPPPQASRPLEQMVLGADAEYSWGPWLVRAEGVHGRFDLPALRRGGLDAPAAALALSAEGVRRLGPGLYVAARFDHLGFSRITGSVRTAPWDAPVSRVEAGIGWQPWRPVTLKLAYQHNRRDEGYLGRQDFLAAQVMARF